MQHGIPLLAAAALLSGSGNPVPASPPPVSQEAPDTFQDIVVTGQRGGRPLPDAVEFLGRFCFEANRRTGKPAPPADEPRWEELDEPTRARFRIADPSVPAFSFTDEGRGHVLLLKFERFEHRNRVFENRCTLVVVGGRDHERLPGQMSRLFKGAGTERHVGHAAGAPAFKGWRQWVWTGRPPRGSRNWRAIQPRRGAGGGSWLVVTDPAFYDEFDYILGDLKTRTDPGRPVSMLSFAYFRRS